jgi:prepilin-type N-terminal cleavage/methylation domain-containing protein
MRTSRTETRPGFTLIELLVVILIILLVSAVTLPTVLPALRQRQVNEAARIFQATLAGARDAAILNNLPRGVRLLPDPVLTQPAVGSMNSAGTIHTGGSQTWAFNRMVPIEPAPDYREGRVLIFDKMWTNTTSDFATYFSNLSLYNPYALCLFQSTHDSDGITPVEATSWYWNVRVGDQIQIGGTGRFYTVIGPVYQTNPENFVNVGPPDAVLPSDSGMAVNNGSPTEVLFLVNGVDDNNDGFIDNGFDGYDNNYNGSVDETAEWYFLSSTVNVGEQEAWLGSQALLAAQAAQTPPVIQPQKYVIKRRPIPSPGAREIFLPSNVVIDMTTWNSTQERSRLPVDHNLRYVDILINPNGSIVPTTSYSAPTSTSLPFYHFWLTDRVDVLPPLWGMNTDTSGVMTPISNPNGGTPTQVFQLPMPAGSLNYSPPNGESLQGERMLVTIFTKTGYTTVTSPEYFDGSDVKTPFYSAEVGVKEAP